MKARGLVKIPSSQFTFNNSAERNRVFLYDARRSGGVKVVDGWNIVGYGQAPWPGSTQGFAVMFEKIGPAEETEKIFTPRYRQLDEGTRIWQHFNERWLEAITEENEKLNAAADVLQKFSEKGPK